MGAGKGGTAGAAAARVVTVEAGIVVATTAGASIGAAAATVLGMTTAVLVGATTGLPNSSTYTVRWMVSNTITVGCVAASAATGAVWGAGVAP